MANRFSIARKYTFVEPYVKKKTKHKIYNDGICYQGVFKYERVAGKVTGGKFKAIDKFPFRYSTIREIDRDYAYGRDVTIDKKIAIPTTDKITTDQVMRVHGDLFNIISIDNDKIQGETFILLQRNKSKGGRTL